jgi:hypothetical protein
MPISQARGSIPEENQDAVQASSADTFEKWVYQNDDEYYNCDFIEPVYCCKKCLASWTADQCRYCDKTCDDTPNTQYHVKFKRVNLPCPKARDNYGARWNPDKYNVETVEFNNFTSDQFYSDLLADTGIKKESVEIDIRGSGNNVKWCDFNLPS